MFFRPLKPKILPELGLHIYVRVLSPLELIVHLFVTADKIVKCQTFMCIMNNDNSTESLVSLWFDEIVGGKLSKWVEC